MIFLVSMNESTNYGLYTKLLREIFKFYIELKNMNMN